ncbi:MAG: gamma-glutamyl-gamma-aminobutyrate hydrolase family protein [Candidatus Promineifilaceae bacterium]|nr:gamma-glutamyl-gamma-aminobutyrate hydrolase family protein [Candidatus Promineifilaceae bacterium]
MNIKILLLQARHDHDQARLDERNSFAARMGLPVEAITTHSLIKAPPTMAQIRRHDALMVGGSGDYYVSKGNLPAYQTTYAVLREVVAVGHPVFASCFGFHLLVEALGGRVGYHPDEMEVGTYELSLTEAARHDELFGHLPARFMAQLGHKDRADRLPEGVDNLARSALAPYQALRIPGEPIWATQFHPEMTGPENLERFHRYKDGYAGIMSAAELAETLARFQDSPEADGLLARFLTVVFG